MNVRAVKCKWINELLDCSGGFGFSLCPFGPFRPCNLQPIQDASPTNGKIHQPNIAHKGVI